MKGDSDSEPNAGYEKTLSMLLLARAINAKDFSELHNSTAKIWQSQTSPEALLGSFKASVEHNVDMTFVADQSPEFQEKPTIDNDGLLVLKGRYPSKPYEVEFELDYHFQNSQWRLFGFNVQTREPK